jgi:hypothetical protein
LVNPRPDERDLIDRERLWQRGTPLSHFRTTIPARTRRFTSSTRTKWTAWATTRPASSSKVGARKGGAQAFLELGGREYSGFVGIQLIKPSCGQGRKLLLRELLIAVLVALGKNLLREHSAWPATSPRPSSAAEFTRRRSSATRTTEPSVWWAVGSARTTPPAEPAATSETPFGWHGRFIIQLGNRDHQRALLALAGENN